MHFRVDFVDISKSFYTFRAHVLFFHFNFKSLHKILTHRFIEVFQPAQGKIMVESTWFLVEIVNAGIEEIHNCRGIFCNFSLLFFVSWVHTIRCSGTWRVLNLLCLLLCFECWSKERLISCTIIIVVSYFRGIF